MEEQSSQGTMDEGVTDGETPAAYSAPTCQPAALASVLPSASAVLSPAFQLAPPIIFPQPSDQHQIALRGVQHANLQLQLQAFWSDKLSEINQTTKFNLNGLPVMDAIGIGMRESRRATATDALQYLWYCLSRKRGRGPATRAVRSAANADRGASPRLAREKVFLSNLLLD
jgi:hypothetical protein